MVLRWHRHGGLRTLCILGLYPSHGHRGDSFRAHMFFITGE